MADNYQGRLIFIPSEIELRDYNGDNSYWGGLEDTQDSIKELLDDLHKDWRTPKLDDPHHASPRLSEDAPTEHGFTPELLIDLGISLTSAGAGVGVYKLLSLWVSTKNGRKLRVRFPSGFEVDATQLSKEEFSEIVQTLAKIDEGKITTKSAKDYLLKQGFTVLKEIDIVQEKKTLGEALQEGLKRIGISR